MKGNTRRFLTLCEITFVTICACLPWICNATSSSESLENSTLIYNKTTKSSAFASTSSQPDVKQSANTETTLQTPMAMQTHSVSSTTSIQITVNFTSAVSFKDTISMSVMQITTTVPENSFYVSTTTSVSSSVTILASKNSGKITPSLTTPEDVIPTSTADISSNPVKVPSTTSYVKPSISTDKSDLSTNSMSGVVNLTARTSSTKRVSVKVSTVTIEATTVNMSATTTVDISTVSDIAKMATQTTFSVEISSSTTNFSTKELNRTQPLSTVTALFSSASQTALSSAEVSKTDSVNQTSRLVSTTENETILLTPSAMISINTSVSQGQTATPVLDLFSSSVNKTNQKESLESTPLSMSSINVNLTHIVPTKMLTTNSEERKPVTQSVVSQQMLSLSATASLSSKASSLMSDQVPIESTYISPSEASAGLEPNTTHIDVKPAFSTSVIESQSVFSSPVSVTRILPSSSLPGSAVKISVWPTSSLLPDSGSQPSTSSIIKDSVHKTPSLEPASSSSRDDLIVTSYATPCYIYYVVTRAVTMATVNQTFEVESVTPTLTVDKVNMSSALHSVTIKPTFSMSTGVMSTAVDVDLNSSTKTIFSVIPDSKTRDSVVSMTKSSETVIAVSSSEATLKDNVSSSTIAAVLSAVSMATRSLPTNVSVSAQTQNSTSSSQYQTMLQASSSSTMDPSKPTHSISEHLASSTYASIQTAQVTSSTQHIPVVKTSTVSFPNQVSASQNFTTMSQIKENLSQSLVVSEKITKSQVNPVPNATLGQNSHQNVTTVNIHSSLFHPSSTHDNSVKGSPSHVNVSSSVKSSQSFPFTSGPHSVSLETSLHSSGQISESSALTQQSNVSQLVKMISSFQSTIHVVMTTPSSTRVKSTLNVPLNTSSVTVNATVNLFSTLTQAVTPTPPLRLQSESTNSTNAPSGSVLNSTVAKSLSESSLSNLTSSYNLKESAYSTNSTSIIMDVSQSSASASSSAQSLRRRKRAAGPGDLSNSTVDSSNATLAISVNTPSVTISKTELISVPSTPVTVTPTNSNIPQNVSYEKVNITSSAVSTIITTHRTVGSDGSPTISVTLSSNNTLSNTTMKPLAQTRVETTNTTIIFPSPTYNQPITSTSSQAKKNVTSSIIVSRTADIQRLPNSSNVVFSLLTSSKSSVHESSKNFSMVASSRTFADGVSSSFLTWQESTVKFLNSMKQTSVKMDLSTVRQMTPNHTSKIAMLNVSSTSSHSSPIFVPSPVLITTTSTNQSSGIVTTNSASMTGYSSAVITGTEQVPVTATVTLPVKLHSTTVLPSFSFPTTSVTKKNSSESMLAALPTATLSTLSHQTLLKTSTTHSNRSSSPDLSINQQTLSTFMPAVQSALSQTPWMTSYEPDRSLRISDIVSKSQFQSQPSSAAKTTTSTSHFSSVLSSSTINANHSISLPLFLQSTSQFSPNELPVVTMSSLGMCYVVITKIINPITVRPTLTSLVVPHDNATAAVSITSDGTFGITPTVSSTRKMQQNITTTVAKINITTRPTVIIATSPFLANVTSVFKVNATSAFEVNATSAFQVNATTAFQVNATSAFKVNATSAFKVNATSAFKVDATSAFKVNATSAFKLSATSAFKVNATSKFKVPATSAFKVDVTSTLKLNATAELQSISSINTVHLQETPSLSVQQSSSLSEQPIEPTQVTSRSTLIEDTVTAPPSTVLSSAVSPSASSVGVTTTSVAIPTTQPTQPPQPPVETVIIIIEVPTDNNVRLPSFKADMEANLERSYINAKANSARKKRATQGVDATITNIKREGFTKSVEMDFYITDNNRTVPAADTADTFSSLPANQLGNTLKYKVVQMPQVSAPPIESKYLVSMVIKYFPITDISIASNKIKLQDNLASYYKRRISSQATITTTISKTLHENTGNVYLEFYTTSNGQRILASEVVKAFEGVSLTLLTSELDQMVLVAPYIADTLKATKFDYVTIRVGLKTSSQYLANNTFQQELGDKLSTVYKEARDSVSSRKKRAVGSIIAMIVNATRSSEPSQADVIFFIADEGVVLNASYVVAIMNRFTILRMTLTTKPYSVFVAPAAYFTTAPLTEIPPVPMTAEPVPYWIIGAVLGPVAFLIILLLICLLCWRWKKGAPQTKVEPETMQMVKRDRARMTAGHFDVARYVQGNQNAVATTALNKANESDIEEKPVRRETSLRRKVQKQRAAPYARGARQNRAFNESEEDEDESVTEVTPSGSRDRLVKAQPGPGMLYKKASQVPVRREEPRPPVRPPPGQQLEEDSETEEETESESEEESVMTERTDQTKHSAAQVPAVAVVGAASGPPRYAPVRFRSSVHPAPSLPPLDMKHTSLVGPKEEDERDIRKDKITKRELKQKADIERWRNKQRMRELKGGRDPSERDHPDSKSEKKAWARTQSQIDNVLEPGTGMEPITRGRKRKPRKAKRRDDSIPGNDPSVQLSAYRDRPSPKADREERDKVSTSETESESEVDMDETRRRMHTLLEDAFTLFGPSLTGKKRKGGELPQNLDQTQLPQHAHARSGQHNLPPELLARPMVPPRYAGSHPALPEPAPAHGRASEPTPRQRRRLAATQPQPQRMPGYPVRTPLRPPLVSKDPMVVWDPMDRQRYVNQRLGYPTYGRPAPGSFAYTDPGGQGPVYMTPVQQQPDGMGGTIWSPYAAEDAMAELYPDLSKVSYPGALSTSPQKDASYLSHPSMDTTRSRDTMVDMDDGYTNQRSLALGQSPQPLIRSIKEELLRLGQGVHKKTPITEL